MLTSSATVRGLATCAGNSCAVLGRGGSNGMTAVQLSLATSLQPGKTHALKTQVCTLKFKPRVKGIESRI